jgi:hypothetical protein
MRNLVSAVAVFAGLMLGCGSGTKMDSPDSLDAVEQGLACAHEEPRCPEGSVCTGLRCQEECPPAGVCYDGSACRVASNGVKYCN